MLGALKGALPEPNDQYFLDQTRKRGCEMEHEHRFEMDRMRTTPNTSRVKAVIAWLLEADREFRVAQSMVDKTKNRF